MFIVLIGSVARNDYSKDSDIDICRIENTHELRKLPDWPNGPINYIDYTFDVFLHLYNSGSLFVYHILNEGILLHGDVNKWNELKTNFIFRDLYREELFSIIKTVRTLKQIEVFGGKYLTLYSNLFILVKNYSIFYLAKNGKFVFNKEKAIKMFFGDYYFDLLISAYNYYERGIVNDNWNYDCKITVTKILKFYLSRMEESVK